MPKIGPYNLYTIEAGRFALDGGAMFGIVPKPLWERKIPSDGKNRIAMNMRCLLIEGEGRLILVDNGLGDKYDKKFADIFAVDPEYATLEKSMQRLGFTPADVTDVILTHLHFDHCGGSTTRVGDRLNLVFSEAIHYVQRKHWDWAQKPNIRERNSFLEDNLAPIGASDQLSLLDGEVEIAPGIRVFTAYGHTEAMQLVRIQDESTTLVYAADLIPTHAHVPMAWNMAYDVRPLATIEEKEGLLEEALLNGWHLFFEHDPEIEVASLHRKERGITIKDARPLEEL